jgi:antitoxin HicB
MTKKYTLSDGKLVLILELAEEGWYAVSSPFEPGLNTQAKLLEEAFKMAYDAQQCLQAARAELTRHSGMASSTRARSSPVAEASPAARKAKSPKATSR